MRPLTFIQRFGPACLGIASLLVVASMSAADMSPAQRDFFENKIRPALAKHCYACHSVDAKKLGGKLLLDSPGEMIGGGESGPSFVPGDPDASLIIQALRYDGLEMPPKKKLPEPLIADFITWVEMGAPDPRPEKAAAVNKTATFDPAALWAYAPIKSPRPPAVIAEDWPHDPLDHFVLAAIEKAGHTPTSDAPPHTLIRRLFFDLTGLPPTAEDIARAESETAAEPIHTLVDRLLQSPQFGEKWGRHWLDVARYAESNGNDGLSRNASFPHAWRYRDYVIQAFNEDLPYDRFLTEQIAGDLLPATTPEQRDRQLIATGFLAIGSKPAKAMNENFEMDIIADQINAVGSGLLGLSVGCARCHDHKNDPIPTRDYYALAGIFKSTETLWGAAAHQGLTAPQTPLHELKAAPKIIPRSEVEPILKANKPRRPPAKAAHTYAPDAPLAMGVREAKTAADCKLNIGGESKKLGPAIPRGFLSAVSAPVPTPAIDPKQSGRLQLAEWLSHPQHPLTARVLVNRVWQQLFGQGFVRTPNDFGVTGDRPTHPELLDHLATRFMREGWSIKKLIRSLVLSRAYQLDSQGPPALIAADPENRLFARHTRRRLDAEALRDAMLTASGGLDLQPGRGSLIQHRDVLINELPPLHQPTAHRSVYLLMLRNAMPPELTPFNLPDATTVIGQRDDATLATQALYLLNNPFVVEQSQRFAQRLLAHPGNEETRLHHAYLSAHSRPPTPGELQQARDFLREADVSLVSTEPNETRRQQAAWAALCQALLASNELRYVD
jgi:hypothetical protein